MLSCHCLNVIIETEGELQTASAETLGLSEEEVQDKFFKAVRQVGKLVNINKTHSGLIQTRNVGSWVIHCCINCGVHSHAVHREKGASCILVNSDLLTKEAIDKLRTSTGYSKLYNIAINLDASVEESLTANSYMSSEVENVIKGLRQVAAESLKNEALRVEERIKQFSDEQYNKLSDLRDRAFREQQILTKIILNSNSNNAKPASTNLGMSNPQGMPSRLNEPLDAGSVKLTSSSNASPSPAHRHTPKRQKSCPLGQINSFDAEGLFELEGTDEVQSGTGSEIEESDVDETINREDGVKIPKRGSIGIPIAKSLPMTIPTFLSQARSRGFEDVDDAPPMERDMDIAASIRALAKSVHGDTVFGDLPKPRYNML